MVYTTLSESFLAWYKDYKKERAKVDDKLDKLLGDSMDNYSSDTGDESGEPDMSNDLDMDNMGGLEEEPTEGSEEGNEPNEEGNEANNEESSETNNPEA